jgi:hypothetical protein
VAGIERAAMTAAGNYRCSVRVHRQVDRGWWIAATWLELPVKITDKNTLAFNFTHTEFSIISHVREDS